MHQPCPPASLGASSKTWPRWEWQRAPHLGARYPVGAVLDELDGVGRDRLGEARPAGTRVILRAAIEERAL
jgi:hypothetical protein